MSKYFSLIAAGAVLLGGCTLAPDYERPASPVADAWPQSLGDPAQGQGAYASDIQWQNFYKDPRLQGLIALALDNNRDLRTALLNVELVRAQYGIQRSALLPTLGAGGSWTRQRTPADLSPSGSSVTANRFDLSVGVVSYEVDLFGRVRSLSEQALQNYLASEEVGKSARIALIAEVAQQYLVSLALEEQLELSRQTLKLVENSLELVNNRYELGNATLLDLRTAQSQVESARGSVALFEESHALARNALVLLVGTALPADLPPAQSLQNTQLLTDVQPWLPSDLLIRRPDIIAAEHRLLAANANIGAARAAFFPSIYITASGGTASAQLSDLFSAGSGVWQFAPTISVPIFTGGRNMANLDAAWVSERIEVAQYEKAIQTAFREVADALAVRHWIGDRLDAHTKLVVAQQERFDLASERYERGVDSYLEVLTAQQDLFRAQQQLIEVGQQRLGNLVTLYKVMGGGWDAQVNVPGSEDEAAPTDTANATPAETAPANATTEAAPVVASAASDVPAEAVPSTAAARPASDATPTAASGTTEAAPVAEVVTASAGRD